MIFIVVCEPGSRLRPPDPPVSECTDLSEAHLFRELLSL